MQSLIDQLTSPDVYYVINTRDSRGKGILTMYVQPGPGTDPVYHHRRLIVTFPDPHTAAKYVDRLDSQGRLPDGEYEITIYEAYYTQAGLHSKCKELPNVEGWVFFTQDLIPGSVQLVEDTP